MPLPLNCFLLIEKVLLYGSVANQYKLSENDSKCSDCLFS